MTRRSCVDALSWRLLSSRGTGKAKQTQRQPPRPTRTDRETIRNSPTEMILENKFPVVREQLNKISTTADVCLIFQFALQTFLRGHTNFAICILLCLLFETTTKT